MKKKSIKSSLLFSYIQLFIGCLIGSAAYPLFLTPNNIAPGGLTGIAVILNYLFHLPVGTISLAMNIPLFLLGYRSVGKIFAFRSLIATLLFSLLIDILPLRPMTMDPLLGTLFGGVLLGIGLGLIIRGGATTGGTDMMASMVNRKYQYISTGTILFAFDFLVVAAAGIIVGTSQALYAMICIFVTAKVMDTVMIGFSGNKACLIVSSSWEEIKKRIMFDMGRGVTQLLSKGGYTGDDRPTLLCVVNRQEIMEIKKIVREVDVNAFMIILEAHEAIGDGFSGIHDT